MPLLWGIEKHILLEAARKVDEVMNKTEVAIITELVLWCSRKCYKSRIEKAKEGTMVEKENGSTSKAIKQRPWAY